MPTAELTGGTHVLKLTLLLAFRDGPHGANTLVHGINIRPGLLVLSIHKLQTMQQLISAPVYRAQWRGKGVENPAFGRKSQTCSSAERSDVCLLIIFPFQRQFTVRLTVSLHANEFTFYL